ncbi:hypothetical protein [Spiroplasma sp. BIUS-1]|uniref:hypothetical protein n=1 Tax=Spiroplasma sp. BIUS-1 TaxID=216964 RepID=UPI0013992F2D|nr:hypothetical protein [Spiroplasma sp. BIUS-1]QHX37084.1 hypothetical protein SBIUS_v1c08310 [Spiroplasma sp. BIUS-1]
MKIIANPISKRIFFKTLKSPYFITLTSIFIILILFLNIIFSVIVKKTEVISNHRILYTYTATSLLLLFVVIYEVWFYNLFYLKDKVDGYYNLELRAEYSSKEIFFSRLIINKLMLISFLVIINIINVITISWVENQKFNLNVVNILIFSLIILIVDLFISSIFGLISQFKSNVLMGVVAGIFSLALPLNFIPEIVTNMDNNYIYNSEFAEENIKYYSGYRLRELSKKNTYVESLLESYNEIDEGVTITEYKIDWIREGFLYYGPTRGTVSFTDGFKNNEIYKLLDEAKKLTDFHKDDTFSEENDYGKEIWTNSYFSAKKEKNSILEGKYNFNTLINKMILSNKNNDKGKDKIEFLNFIKIYANNIYSLKSYQLQPIFYTKFIYEEGKMQSLEGKTFTPGEIILANVLNEVLVNALKITNDYESKNNNMLTYGGYNGYKMNLYLNSFLNPFYVLNEFQSYNFADNEIMKMNDVINNPVVPSGVYFLYKTNIVNDLTNQDYPKWDDASKNTIKFNNLEYILFINAIICLLISALTLYIFYKQYNKLLIQ